ncbi:MAG: 6-bladed beta-propeller [Terriglobales bacterium]
MVQGFLARTPQGRLRTFASAVLALLLLMSPVWAASKKDTPTYPAPPDLLLEGNRKLVFERAFSSEKEVRGKPGFWTRLVDVVAGAPDYRGMIRPYGIAIDSHGRAIITDPGAKGVHIFDFVQHKYKFIQRAEKDKDPMIAPQCVAVDARDNIYVADSEAGKIFVFDANGKFKHALGSLKGGEGFFKRPTGIAVDSAAQRIYVTDTLRDKIFVLDMQGEVMQTIGKHGAGDGEFYFPTELHLDDHNLLVVDTMNFRIQFLGLTGDYQGKIGQAGDSVGQMFRPKGIGEDSEGHYYVADGLWGTVQVFDREGQLLYYFGQRGTGLGEFQLPSGLSVDRNDRIYVVDSFNRRVQVFRYYAARTQDRSQR